MSYAVRIVGPAGREMYLSAPGLVGAKLFACPDEAWSAAIDYAKTHARVAVSVEDTRDAERVVT